MWLSTPTASRPHVPIKAARRSTYALIACRHIKGRRWHADAAPDIAQANATFCLEPAGDSPYRKSLSDSIALGCIPVLFHSYTDAVAPWMWADWKCDARVLVPRARFLQGRIDLVELLGSIPRPRVEAMRATLVKHRTKFLYSTGALDDERGDAAHIVLAAVHAMATGTGMARPRRRRAA